MDANHEKHDQKIAYARASLWAPFYAVGLAARIQGAVPTDRLEAALRKLKTLYPPLASRVRVEQNGAAWLTTEGVGDYRLEVRPKTSSDDWLNIFLEQEKIPFAFGDGPVTRFFLLRGEDTSDLVVIAPHVVCDGYSMTHVMWDAVALLNDPNRVVTPPSSSPVVTWQTVSHSPYDNLILRGLVRVANRVWPDDHVIRQQERYEELHRCYWARQQNAALSFSLSPAETTSLVARCRQHGVSVTGALVAAFLLALAEIRPAMQAIRKRISVAVNIRDRMIQNPGRVVGVYASSIDVTLHSKMGTPFWDVAREGHTIIHKSLNNRRRILRPLVMDELDPSIADALVTAVSTDQWDPKADLLSRFVNIKGENRWLNVSNIGRVDLPEVGTPYRLETLLPFPPLVPGGGMALNVLTINGGMNITLKFRMDRYSGETAAKIRDRALGYISAASN